MVFEKLSLINIILILLTISSSNSDGDDKCAFPLTSLGDWCFGIMPRPGQSDTLHFDNTNIMEFLYRWNNECEDFGLSESQRYTRLPDYCIPETKDTIELLSDYKGRN